MKLDLMTAGAVGFAAFTAWYVLKKPATASTGAGANPAIASAVDQRQQVGAGVAQNTNALYSLFGQDISPNLTYMGGGQGLTL